MPYLNDLKNHHRITEWPGLESPSPEHTLSLSKVLKDLGEIAWLPLIHS